jgi:DNA-binding NarL/FixJ family response regulator
VAGVLARLEISLAGAATSARAALALVAKTQPDLLVMDVSLGADDMDGFLCLAEARRIREDLRCIVLSDADSSDRIASSFQAGASAYVLKTADSDELASAVRQSFRRSVYFPPSLQSSAAVTPEASRLNGLLTPREIEILGLVAAGGQSAEIARRLWVTEQTVKFHLSNIYRKLGVSNRTEASRWAFEHGIVPVERASSNGSTPHANRTSLRTRAVRTNDSK